SPIALGSPTVMPGMLFPAFLTRVTSPGSCVGVMLLFSVNDFISVFILELCLIRITSFESNKSYFLFFIYFIIANNLLFFLIFYRYQLNTECVFLDYFHQFQYPLI